MGILFSSVGFPDQPFLHALLNGTAAVFLLLGWQAIKRGDERTHKRWMLSALAVSAVFLASYLQYHFRVGSVPFWGEGWIKVFYLFVLIPHVILAVAMLPMIGLTLSAISRGDTERHRRFGRWTLPVWLYVSVTGVLVYLMNFVLRPEGLTGF